jgi:hypothetical protein
VADLTPITVAPIMGTATGATGNQKKPGALLRA